MLKKHDWVITTIVAILSIIGVFTILSTNIDTEGNLLFSGIVTKQLIFIFLGTFFYFLSSLADYRYLRFKQLFIPIYLVTLGILLATLIWGPVINNVNRWILIGDFQLQPAEFSKLTVIIISAVIMSSRKKVNDLYLASLSFLTILPVLILIYLQPHGSMTIMVFLIWLMTVFTYIRDQRRNVVLALIGVVVGIGVLTTFIFDRSFGIILLSAGSIIAIFAFYTRESWRIYAVSAIILGLLGGFAIVGSWNWLIKDYQKERVVTFLEQEDGSDDKAFNVEQSKVAIGSGGLFGKGFGFGTQSRLNYLPEHQTDFVFATYSEQFGLIGSIFLLSLYSFLIIKIFLKSMDISKSDQFGSMLMFGIGIMLLLEVFINIGTNTGIIPATGIPLPLISSGGSSILLTFFSLGLIQSIISHTEIDPDKESFIDKQDLLI